MRLMTVATVQRTGSGTSSDSTVAAAACRGNRSSNRAPPSGLSAIAFTDEWINLTWDDNANNENSYRVEQSAGGAIWQTLTNLPANSR